MLLDPWEGQLERISSRDVIDNINYVEPSSNPMMRVLAFLLVLFLMAMAGGAVAQDRTPSEMDVICDIAVDHSDFDVQVVTFALLVHEYDINGTGRPADDIRNSTSLQNEVIAAAVQRSEGILDIAFPNSVIDQVSATYDQSSLDEAQDTDPSEYHPVVAMDLTFEVNSTKGTYDMFGFDIRSIDDLIRGTLNMGGSFERDILLGSPEGWNTTYYVSFDTGHVPSATSPVQTGSPLVWHLDNTMGTISSAILDQYMVIQDDPTGDIATKQVEAPNHIDIIVDMPEYRTLDIGGEAVIYGESVDELGITLPNTISIDRLNADGMRLYVDNGLTTWDQIEFEIDSELVGDGSGGGVEDTLSETFNTQMTLGFHLDNATTRGATDDDRYNVDDMDSQVPIRGVITAPTTEPDIYGDFDDHTIQGFMNGGAKSYFDFEIDLDGYTYLIEFSLPKKLRYESSTVSFNETAGERYRYEFSGEDGGFYPGFMVGAEAPNYDSNRTKLDVELDIYEVNLWEGLAVYYRLKAIGKLYIMEPPEDVKEEIPDTMVLEYMSADLVRLAYEKDLLTDEEVEAIEDDLLEEFTNQSGDLMGDEANVTLGSLNLGYDINDMDENPPITIKLISSGSQSLLGGGGGDNGGNGDEQLIGKTLNMSLGSIEGWNTTYRLTMPKGIEFTEASSEEADIKIVNGGRTLVVNPYEEIDEAEFQFRIEIGPQFCYTLCWPFILIFLLIVLVKILLKYRKYRKEMKQENKEEERRDRIIAAAKRRGLIPKDGTEEDEPEVPPRDPRMRRRPPPDDAAPAAAAAAPPPRRRRMSREEGRPRPERRPPMEEPEEEAPHVEEGQEDELAGTEEEEIEDEEPDMEEEEVPSRAEDEGPASDEEGDGDWIDL